MVQGVTNGLCEHSRACEHCDFFFASTIRDKKFALRAVSSLKSTTREQRALLIFSACSKEILFFKRKQRILLKEGVILIAKFKEISGPFILGKLAQNLKRTSSKVKTHLYASDPEDCLIFNYEFTAQVEKHLVIGTVWEVQFTDEDFHIDLNQELYEECLKRTRGVEERDMTDVDEGELQEEQDPRVRTTSSGRILKLPNRFY